MYLPCVKRLLTGVFILWGGALSAQTSGVSNPLNGRENNPYSKYGIGELANGNSALLRGMGNTTSSYASPFFINSDNPASYAFLKRTAFEAGGMASSRTITGSGFTYKTGTATLAYLTLAMPAGKKGGLCLGFKPVSRTFYSMVDTIGPGSNQPAPIGPLMRNYSGEGGLNYAYIGAARRFGGFSVGFNFGYLFGTLRNTTRVDPLIAPYTADTILAFSAIFTNYTRIGGIYWKGGAMYERRLDSNYILRAGATASITQDIRQRFENYQVSTYKFPDTLANDTMYAGSRTGVLTMPLTYSIGVSISNNDKWSIALDYSGTQWSAFKSTPDTSRTFGVGSGSYKISVGGSYTPDVNSVRNYLSRMTYRLGFYYGADYLNLAGTAIPVYGFTVGGSLPFKRSPSGQSSVHLALDMGRLGTQQNNLMQQSYMRFTLGITLNDRWFIPRKYD